jgi:DNA-binding CsgD family transcriptional regulator
MRTMTLNETHFNVLRQSRPHASTEQKLNQLQADLVHTAQIWAMDELGAAIAHELSEPLTALLLYLNAIQRAGERATGLDATGTPFREIVERAEAEAARACNIMERLLHAFEKPANVESAVARGRKAIDAWARNNRDSSIVPEPPPAPFACQHLLTPREREVLAQITSGTSNKEGGRRLGLSTRTFEVHRAHIMEKFGARNAADLVRIALSESDRQVPDLLASR